MKTFYSCMTLALVSVLAVLTVSACGTTTPAPSAPTAAPTAAPAPTLPPAKETVVVIQTVVVQPTAVLSVTSTATFTPTARAVAPASTRTVAPGGKLEFTADDIEYAPVIRKGDNKIQLTIILRPSGGVPPFSFVLDPGSTVENRIKGLTYTFDWHNCGESEPHSIILTSADGQTSKTVSFIPPYSCP